MVETAPIMGEEAIAPRHLTGDKAQETYCDEYLCDGMVCTGRSIRIVGALVNWEYGVELLCRLAGRSHGFCGIDVFRTSLAVCFALLAPK